MSETLREVEAWRESREPGWYHDIGYKIQDVIQAHRYAYERKGSRPTDPGWHECTCGWEGYWSGFQPHVADHVRALLAATAPTPDEVGQVEGLSDDERETVRREMGEVWNSWGMDDAEERAMIGIFERILAARAGARS